MINRRKFLNAAALATATTTEIVAQESKTDSPVSQSLRNAVEFGNRFVLWQSPYGSVDPVICPYRSPGRHATGIQALGPPVRALYRLFQATGKTKYKAAADRYATYLMNTLHDPPTPYSSRVTINGQSISSLSAAWEYGKAFSPCFEWFSRMNPNEGAYDQKAYAMYEWLQRHRRPDSYFGVGYPAGKYPDAQFSCDLGEVGTGLMGFYTVTRHKPALDDAVGLASFFLTDYQEGSGKGVWSPRLGMWLVGPWPGGGAEHFTDQQYNTSAWGWSALVDGEFLLRLREHTEDAALKVQIDDKCVKALRWCVDACQFDDGAHGMFGRDDKWVGQNAAAILLYLELKRRNAIPVSVDGEYRPRIEKAWKWLLAHTAPDTYPADGYIRVTGRTSRKPPENLLWMMAWTVEALLEAPKQFGA
jgi:hypothetical protein